MVRLRVLFCALALHPANFAADWPDLPPRLPIAAARTRALHHDASPICLEGSVSLESGVLTSAPGDFYFQDASGGIAVHSDGKLPIPRGAIVRACGNLQLQDKVEPELSASTVSIIATGKQPTPKRLTVQEALRGAAPGQLVTVRATVIMSTIGEVRDTLFLGPGDPPLRAYVRRPIEQTSVFPTIAPLGAEAEITGILIPDERNAYQIRMRATSDAALIDLPVTREIIILRVAVACGAILALAVFLWIVTLRRAVRSQTREIRSLMVQSQASSRHKAEFLANMSHEIRTPLNGILGMTELALSTTLTAEQRSYLNTVRSSSHALLEVINDILDFSRIEKGKLTVINAPFHPGRLLAELEPLIAVSTRNKHLDFRIAIHPDVPPCVSGDASRLRQVLINLLGNAVKFTNQGSISPTVRPAPDQALAFAVTDTGIGIPNSRQEEIFQAFSQADASISRDFGGSGLGLTISAQLVQLMGGRIQLASKPGKGSTFSFTLPLPPCQAPSSVAGEQVQTSFSSSLSRMASILVAEDNEVNRCLVAKLLEKKGHSVDLATNGEEAAAKARSGRYDLIFMDVQMPVADGFQATRQIRSWEDETGAARTPIVALTAHALAEHARQCREAGMDDFLAKPFQPESLYQILTRHLPPSGR